MTMKPMPKGHVAMLDLSARALRDRMASGALNATDLVQACLDRIAALEPDVQAWAWLDGGYAMQQAQALDAARRAGRPTGPLHGLPVALKDVIDTAKIPTQNGTPLDEGRVPRKDAALVDRLRAAGAVIIGKTVTAELAFMHPGKTRNPHDAARTPGGSSSGSAAAVAAGMVPLAVGTQTGGSVIRPAAFCGTVGFKPSFGAIPRTGVLSQSPTLDTVGVFARSIEDAALLAEALYGHDAGDRATALSPPPRLHAIAMTEPPVRPTLAFLRPPGWDRAEADTHAAFAELAEALGEQCFETALPGAFDEAAEIRARINLAEMAKSYYAYEKRGREQLSEEMREALDQGKSIPARDYIAALDWPDVLYAGLDEIFERCDAILCPAAPGPAPEGHAGTGDSIFNGLWTLCGTPAVTVPILQSETGLPMGAQLIGRRGDDARLLRTARWLEGLLSEESDQC
ncbi:amidase [Limimaricola sp.]|uniref:amidase n=1 Tax=Limimaricola sp. TaxID=2211665 RepID=UPI00405A3C9F